MNKELSSTKWGRVYVNQELIEKLRDLWLNQPRREVKLATGIAYTMHPDGKKTVKW